MNVGPSNDTRLKMIRPLSPGKVALDAMGVTKTTAKAPIATERTLALLFIVLDLLHSRSTNLRTPM